MRTPTELGGAGCTAVERHPQHDSGAWLFRGTRVPVAALLKNLEDGVTPEQARSVLEEAARSTATSS